MKSRVTVDAAVAIDVGRAVLGIIPCNGAEQRVPGGIVRTGRLAGGGV